MVLGQEVLSRTETEAPGVTDASDFRVTGVAGRCDALRVQAVGRSSSGSGRFVGKSFVWPKVEVVATNATGISTASEPVTITAVAPED